MPTAITHALVGASLAGAASPAARGPALVLSLAALAALPDADVIGLRLGIPYEHPLGHRGFTHSLTFAVCAGLALALAFRRRVSSASALRSVALLGMVATASHGLLDAFTDAGRGVGFFIPFDDARFFFPFRPLATSPLSVRAFFEGPALAILANEALWVWLPLGLVLTGQWIGGWSRRD